MIYVAQVHMSTNGTSHEHIEEVRWWDSTDANPTLKEASVPSMVDFIEKGGAVQVQVQGPPAVNVGVNQTANGRKFIQTYADKTWTNNLLSLTRY